MAKKKPAAQSDGGTKPPSAYGANTTFKCPKCKNKVTVHVPLVYAPACLQHAGKITVMEVA